MAGRHLATPDDSFVPDPRHGEHLVDPGARISDGTSVTVDLEAMPQHPEAAPSPARPDELVDRGQVGDGHEME
jgi:hypothetical protein